MDHKIDLASALALAYIEKNGTPNYNQSYENFCENFLFIRGEMEKSLEKFNQTHQSLS